MHKTFWSRNMKGKDHLEVVGIDEKIILKIGLTEIGWDCVDQTHLGQDTDRLL